MKTATIEELAYLIKQAKDGNLPQPIIFLGAGASKTGGIPLASEIVDDILKKGKGVKSLLDCMLICVYPRPMSFLVLWNQTKSFITIATTQIVSSNLIQRSSPVTALKIDDC